jgi:hypothetical protein
MQYLSRIFRGRIHVRDARWVWTKVPQSVPRQPFAYGHALPALPSRRSIMSRRVRGRRTRRDSLCFIQEGARSRQGGGKDRHEDQAHV